MDDRFFEPVDWIGAGWALAVWLAHFTVLWAASVVFPHQAAARWTALGATLIALAALGWLWRIRKVSGLRSVPGLGVAMASAAILFGAMPAAVG